MAMRDRDAGSLLQRALSLTREIFRNVRVDYYTYKGYQLIWALYDLVHIRFSIPYLLEKTNSSQKEINKKSIGLSNRVVRRIKTFAVDVFFAIYSLFSIVYVAGKNWILNRKTVAIWTGDFYDPSLRGDFRVGSLYLKLIENGIDFVDLIRIDGRPARICLLNLLRRRRKAVYYTSMIRIIRLLLFFIGKTYERVELEVANDLHYCALKRYIGEMPKPHEIELIRLTFKFMRISHLISWEFSSRQAPLVYAAKLARIPVIGFMHGAGMPSYMAHEFIPDFDAELKIGPDVMGVWSNWWRSLYIERSRLYGKVVVSGTFRKPNVEKVKREVGKPKEMLNILWICEPLVDPEEVIDYIEFLYRSPYRLLFKKRPLTFDAFYDKLLRIFPSAKNCPICEGDVFEAIVKADVVIGSHSTAVIDACQVGVPFILVNTRKWGNYFEVEDFFAEDVKKLEDVIEFIRVNDVQDKLQFYKERFFGFEDQDGADWVLRVIGEKDFARS